MSADRTAYHITFIVIFSIKFIVAVSEWAHQHISGYLVPYHRKVDLYKGGYNQGYLATIKIE